MTEVHYGVVRMDGRWTVIGNQLRFGAYSERDQAERVAARLAEQSTGVGLPVKIHLQDEDGRLQASPAPL